MHEACLIVEVISVQVGSACQCESVISFETIILLWLWFVVFLWESRIFSFVIPVYEVFSPFSVFIRTVVGSNLLLIDSWCYICCVNAFCSLMMSMLSLGNVVYFIIMCRFAMELICWRKIISVYVLSLLHCFCIAN
jgi:hypothetical protein